MGAQFLGRTGEEALLFALAEQLAEVQPWADRWPPISRPKPRQHPRLGAWMRNRFVWQGNYDDLLLYVRAP